MRPIALPEALARSLRSPGAPARPVICYAHPGAAREAAAACSLAAERAGLGFRELFAPGALGDWDPQVLTLARVDCSASDPALAIERWVEFLADPQAGPAVAFFSRADALDDRGKELAASLAFDSRVQCVFASSAPTLCDLFSALRAALPPRALARVDFCAPEGSEAWGELRSLGAMLDAVDGHWSEAPRPEPRVIEFEAPPPRVVVAKPAPARGLAAFFERLGLGR